MKKGTEEYKEYARKYALEYYYKHRDNFRSKKRHLDISKERKSAYDHKFYKNHREKLKNVSKEYYANNKEKVSRRRVLISTRYKDLIARSKKRKIICTITFEMYMNLISQPCYYCKNELGKQSQTGCGLDRLDNNLGYIDSNCVSCCGICNKIKNNFLSPEQTKVAIKAIIEYNKLHEK